MTHPDSFPFPRGWGWPGKSPPEPQGDEQQEAEGPTPIPTSLTEHHPLSPNTHSGQPGGGLTDPVRMERMQEEAGLEADTHLTVDFRSRLQPASPSWPAGVFLSPGPCPLAWWGGQQAGQAPKEGRGNLSRTSEPDQDGWAEGGSARIELLSPPAPGLLCDHGNITSHLWASPFLLPQWRDGQTG